MTNLTPIEYAAIHLRVPMSDNPAIDKMIIEARRMDAAQAAMLAMTSSDAYTVHGWSNHDIAAQSKCAADALMAAMVKK